MIKEAVILAGGFGTRLRGVVDNLPKPMAPVNGIPFMTWLLNYLEKQNIRKAIISSGYRNEVISEYFGYSYRNLSIEYSVENEPLGTGGALLLATEKIKGDFFYLLNGDTYFEVDLSEFESFYKKTDSVLSVALKPVKNAGRYGTVTLRGDRIVSFSEKQQTSEGIINGGLYIIDKEWYRNVSPGRKFSIEKDLLEKMVADYTFTGYVSDVYFIDIGVPEDYFRAGNELPPIR